ncbi:ribonuclease P protein component (RNase P) [Legionella drozanskii LLAP-1]|uniref:Ribonuclease P protein component (RNase P) n=2 Tax=Legionellaceae TaxID=444 RepID=A0A0W0SN41_9GAMM|nr:ribonuclease P protein component (RNase P) [Legionella drozanskii LLAP-1]
MKRLIRETFRTTRLPAMDVIFLARHGLAEKENKTIIAGLGKIWDKLIALYAA